MGNQYRESAASGVVKRIVIPTAAILLLIVIFLQVDSNPSSEETLSDSTVVSAERIYSISFDTFEGGVPSGMALSDEAQTAETTTGNLIEQDTNIFTSGGSSLRITGKGQAADWHSLSVDIPGDVSRITARFFVKGEELELENSQSSNCYAGFWYDDLLGESNETGVSIPVGNSDWTEVTVSLDAGVQFAENINFRLYYSVTNTVWIDELTFVYDDECPAIEEPVLEEPISFYIEDLYRPTTFMDLAFREDFDCPDSISAGEALEDAEMLRYLFENAYSGYAYWQGRGVDFSSICDDLIILAEDNERISVVDIENIIAGGLTEMQDGHFALSGHGHYRFLKRKTAFFTEVVVERIQLTDEESEYKVILSNSDAVEPDMIYSGPEERLFRILSRNGTEQFQVGVFASEFTHESVFQFRSSSTSESIIPVVLTLHENRMRSSQRQPGEIYSRTEVDGIDLVSVSSFSHDSREILLDFVDSGAELAETDRLIVNLMGNHGGSSSYARSFILNLNGEAEWNMYYAFLCSPATLGSIAAYPLTDDTRPETRETVYRLREALEQMRERPFRNWMYVRNELPARQMGNYEGTAVFLIDREVASSGEALVDYSKSIPGVVLVGENSAGVGTFGEVQSYWLPNSHIQFSIPSKLFLVPGFEEGIGYLPDYWLDSSEPVAEIARWLNNPDSYQFEFPDPPVLHDLNFEEFENDLPQFMNVRVGATSGGGNQYSTITQDFEIKAEGNSSLRLEGDANTDIWNSLYMPVPEINSTVNVTYSVRSESVNCEGNQFNNCYVGFIYKDAEGNRQINANSYTGSFEWKQDSLQFDNNELNASCIEFHFFLSKSGNLWIDDVVFSE